MKLIRYFFRRFAFLYTKYRLNVAAAGLAYYIMMTFFPLLICIYSLLGNNYEWAMRVIEFVAPLLPARAVEYTMSFMDYVSENYSLLMMLLALSVILITASAAFRSLENTIGAMQGKRRYEGVMFFLFSIILSLGFTITIYLAILAMFFGNNIIRSINLYLPFLNIGNVWVSLRYLLLFGVAFAILILIFEICKSKDQHYSTAFGALTATGILVGISAVFSTFINFSIKYPLIYSSLASLILLMFWLYCCCQAVYCGAAVNIVLRDMKEETSKS